MYTSEFFNDKRVILKNMSYPQLNGKRVILSKAKLDDMENLIAETNIQHPEHNNIRLWVDVRENASHILNYNSSLLEYRNKVTQETVILKEKCDNNENKHLMFVGTFDIYNKEPIIFDLLEHPDLIPNNILNIFYKYDIENGLDYPELAEMLKEVELLGYTFDYGLDAQMFDLKKL